MNPTKPALDTDTACSDYPIEGYFERHQRTKANLGDLTHHWVLDLKTDQVSERDKKPPEMEIVKE